MEDFKLVGACDHRVSQILTLRGTSPNFVADLLCSSNSSAGSTFIHELVQTDPAVLFGMRTPGITNFSLSADGRSVVFGAVPVTAGMYFPDPNPDYVPARVYFCSYVAAGAVCPKCKGRQRCFDMHFDTSSRLSLVQGHDKASQQLLKILLTERGSNLFDKLYGSTLSSLVGKRVTGLTAAQLQFSILQAVEHLIKIQAGAGVPDDERIVSLSDISASRSASDSRLIDIKVVVMLADYTEVPTTFALRI